MADKALAILKGKSSTVAAAIRRKATRLELDADQRAKADRAADYLLNKRPYLDYPTALTNGWPIATGVIKGACRHLVKDRMDITGARWGLDGAEAVLKLRAIKANGNLDEYWRYHLTQERRRIHEARYANFTKPATPTARSPGQHDVPLREPHPSEFHVMGSVRGVGRAHKRRAVPTAILPSRDEDILPLPGRCCL